MRLREETVGRPSGEIWRERRARHLRLLGRLPLPPATSDSRLPTTSVTSSKGLRAKPARAPFGRNSGRARNHAILPNREVADSARNLWRRPAGYKGKLGPTVTGENRKGALGRSLDSRARATDRHVSYTGEPVQTTTSPIISILLQFLQELGSQWRRQDSKHQRKLATASNGGASTIDSRLGSGSIKDQEVY